MTSELIFTPEDSRVCEVVSIVMDNTLENQEMFFAIIEGDEMNGISVAEGRGSATVVIMDIVSCDRVMSSFCLLNKTFSLLEHHECLHVLFIWSKNFILHTWEVHFPHDV